MLPFTQVAREPMESFDVSVEFSPMLLMTRKVFRCGLKVRLFLLQGRVLDR